MAGLVCEGTSDVEVFSALIRALWPDVSHILPIQPECDELGHAQGASGWSGVRSWCKAHAGRLDEVIEPGIGDRLDLLVVALDVDIAVEAGIEDPPAVGSAYDAKRLCGKVHEWLAPTVKGGESPVLPRELVISIPAMSVEAWILAALYNQASPETIENATAVLVEKGQLEWDARRPRKARKLPARYRAFAAQVAGRIARVRKRCPEAERTCRKIERLRDG